MDGERVDNVTMQVGGKTIVVERPRLRLWLSLDELQGEIVHARVETDKAEAILRYLTVSTGIDFSDNPWFDTVSIFGKIVSMCTLRQTYPFMKDRSSTDKKQPWDYSGRSFYATAHLLAYGYGWSLEEISNLIVEDAFAMLQELYVEEQLQREWQWGLSELAYPYNSRTKKTEFKPLDRPAWMHVIPEIKKVKIRKDMMPLGNVIDLSGVVK